MQLELFVFPFPCGSWARQARKQGCVVVWISDPLEALKAELATKLKASGASLQDSQSLDNGLVLCLWAPEELRSRLLAQLPRPKSAGTFTPGNFLPW